MFSSESAALSAPDPATNRPPLRVAVVLPDRPLSHAAQRIVKHILDGQHLHLSALIAEPPPQASNSWTERALRTIAKAEGAIINLPEHVDGAAKTIAEVADRADAPVLASIPAQSIDIIVDLGTGATGRISASTATHGAVAVQPSNHAAGLHEVALDQGLTAVRLVQLGAVESEDNRIKAARYKTQTSWTRNNFFLADEATNLVTDHLNALAAGTVSQRTAEPNPAPAVPPSIPLLGRYAFTAARNLAVPRATSLLSKTGRPMNRWSLFIGAGRPAPDTLAAATETRPPRDEFWADPFLHAHDDGNSYVFFENFEDKTGLGKISVGRVYNRKITDVQDAIVTNYHLSFPFVFSHRGDLYMVPETAQRRRIEIWKCAQFPNDWQRHSIVMDGLSCTDSTIVRHDGTWWLFTNIARGSFDDHNSELHVFAADSPMLRDLTPHRHNPVVVDARTARNGGRPFVRDNSLFRFAQNNAHRHYGHGLSLMRVTRLSLDDYAEKIDQDFPSNFAPGVSRIHHADVGADLFVCDGFRTFG